LRFPATINAAFSVPVADEKVLVPKKPIGALHVPHHVPIDALVEPAAIFGIREEDILVVEARV